MKKIITYTAIAVLAFATPTIVMAEEDWQTAIYYLAKDVCGGPLVFQNYSASCMDGFITGHFIRLAHCEEKYTTEECAAKLFGEEE